MDHAGSKLLIAESGKYRVDQEPTTNTEAHVAETGEKFLDLAKRELVAPADVGYTKQASRNQTRQDKRDGKRRKCMECGDQPNNRRYDRHH